MKGLIITVIGGGSSYTPELVDGFISRSRELPVAEIRLADIPAGREKLAIIGGLADRMVKKAGLNIAIKTTLDRREALAGAHFVVAQLRVGGLAARVQDERLPLRHGVIGQETTGPGGFANALRTIPVMLDICRDIEELCPAAWLINFTNPSGLITEAIVKYSSVKCLGLCNVPINMKMTVAKMLEAAGREVEIDFAGLNHLVWGLSVRVKGRDVMSEVLAKMSDGASLSMKNIPDLKWDKEFLTALGLLPCPYHRYYYMADRILAEELEAAAPGGPGTRAEQVKTVEDRLFSLYRAEELAEKPSELEKRGGAYYSEAAVSLISAIHNDKQEIHTVDVANAGAISGLPADSVVEVNCLVGKSGAVPLPVGTVPTEISGLIKQVKAYEILTIEAGVHGNTDKALLALVNHPLVPSVTVAKALLQEIIAANRDYLPQFPGI